MSHRLYGRGHFRQNLRLGMNYIYCYMIWGWWGWCYRWHGLQYKYHDYYSHEFRNIPGDYDDWYGMDVEAAWQTFALGSWTRLSSESQRIDVRWDQDTGATSRWMKYYDGNVSNRVRRHHGQPGYARTCRRKFHFSWEKKKSCITGYWHCWGRRRCRWWLATFPWHVWWWSYWRFAAIWEHEKFRFPKSIKSVRFRNRGNGQKYVGYMWYYAGHAHLFHVPYRFMALKSKYVEKGRAFCIVDQAPFWRGATRYALGMSCAKAAEVADGRDIWFMNHYPNYRRWEHDGAYIVNGGDRPMIQGSHHRNRATFLENINENSLYSPHKDKCIAIEGQKYTFDCSKNVSASASSSAKIFDNYPCAPGLPKPKPFQWLPNDPKLWIRFSFREPFVVLDKIEVEWKTAPKIFTVSCYGDLWHRWYTLAVVNTKGKTSHTIHTTAEYCSHVVFRIIEVDKKRMKCKEGICAGITKVKFHSPLRTLKYQRCLEKSDSEASVRFFNEPSIVWTVFRPRWTIWYYTTHRKNFVNTLASFMMKYFKLEALNKNLEINFGTDLATDQKVKLEPCEKGACLALVKSPNLPKILKSLLEVGSRFGKMSVKGGLLGETKSTPAPSCSFAKAINGVSLDGFIWIKNKCSKEVSKVYCRMNTVQPKGLMIANAHEFKGINIRLAHGIYESTHMLKACAPYGFSMANVSTVDDIQSIALTSMLYGFTFHKTPGIVLGYDFPCQTYKGCSGNWYSPDGTLKLNSLATKFNGNLGKPFSPIKGNEVLLLHNGQLKTVSLSSSHISAVACATTDERNMYPIGCDVSYSDLMVADAMLIVCKNDCSASKNMLYGTAIYSELSSVCKAVMHTGSYIEYNGLFVSMVTTYKSLINDYTGSEQNGISSKPLKMQTKAFTVSSFNEQCSSEKVKALSFNQQQMTQNIDLNNLLNEITTINQQNMNNLRIPNYYNNNLGLYNGINSNNAFNNNNNNQLQYNMQPNNQILPNYNNQILPNYNNQVIPNYNLNAYNNNPNQDMNMNMNQINNLSPQAINTLENIIQTAKSKSIIANNIITKYNSDQNYINNRSMGPKEAIYINNRLPEITVNPVFPVKKPNKSLENSLKINHTRYNLWKNADIESNLDPEQRQYFRKPSLQPGHSAAQLMRKDHMATLVKEMNGYFKLSKVNYDDFQFAQINMTDSNYDEDIDSTQSSEKNYISMIKEWADNDTRVFDKYKLNSESKKYKRYLKQIYNMSTANPIYMKLFKQSGIYSQFNDGKESMDAHKDFRDDSNNFRFMKKKDWKKEYPNLTFDIRSDEKKDAKEYYYEKDVNKSKASNYFKKDGDGTNLTAQVTKIKAPSEIKLSQEKMAKWRDYVKDTYKFLSKNEKSLKVHEPIVEPIVKDYKNLLVFAYVTLKAANKELAMVKKTLFLLEDKYLSLFKYVDIAYVVDIVTGVSTALPDYWLVLNPKQSSEDLSIFKVSKQGVEPHLSAIKLTTDPLNAQTGLGVIMSTRYHKTFDGSFHFSLKIPKSDSVVGAYFRYTDEFTNYAIKFIPKTQTFYVYLNSPFDFKIIHAEKKPCITANKWIRVVVQFTRYKINLWIEDEKETAAEELNEENRKVELSKPGVIQLFDPGLKEGRIGFFCNDCMNVMFASIQLYSDKCYIKNSNSSNFKLVSPYSARYTEDYTQKLLMKMKAYIYKGAKFKGDFMYSNVPGRKKGISVTNNTFHPNLIKSAANLVYFKDQTLICIDKCNMKVSTRFMKGDRGNSVIGFKFNNPVDYYAVVLTKTKKKDYVKLFKYDKRGFVLSTHNLKHRMKGWVSVYIKVDQDSIKVVVNNKVIFDKFKDDKIDKKRGTLMLGINNVIAAFSDIKIGAQLPKGYLKMLAKKKLNKKREQELEFDISSDGLSGGFGELDGSESLSGGNDTDDANKTSGAKSGISEYKCLHLRNRISRYNWCKIEFYYLISRMDALDRCVDGFCEICCNMNAKSNKIDCKNTCNRLTIKEAAPIDYFNICYDQFYGENNAIKLNSCISCCDEMNNPYLFVGEVSKCVSKCYSKFGKPEGIANWGKYSMLRRAYNAH